MPSFNYANFFLAIPEAQITVQTIELEELTEDQIDMNYEL